MRRFLLCASVQIGLLAGCVYIDYAFSWLSWCDFCQVWKGELLIATSGQVPTVTATLGSINPGKSGSVLPGVAEAILRVSLELDKHHNRVNVRIGVEHSYLELDYYSSAQMVEYSPEGPGTTYRYEHVTPAIIHILAKDHAGDLHHLVRRGCPETVYAND